MNLDLNPSTWHMIGRDALSCMKPSAYLINTSRGAVIDQIALTETLRARRTARAALHVLEQEPPSPGDPILKLDNVIVLPHIGTATAEAKCTAIDRRDANANPRGVRSLLNLLPRHFDVFELGKATIHRALQRHNQKFMGVSKSHGSVRLLQQGETGCEDPGRVAYP